MDSRSPSSVKKNAAINPCSYGEDCYRQNPKHFEEYSHPHLEDLVSKMKISDTNLPPGYKQKISRRILDMQIGFQRNIKKYGSALGRSDSNVSNKNSSAAIEDQIHKNSSSSSRTKTSQSSSSSNIRTLSSVVSSNSSDRSTFSSISSTNSRASNSRASNSSQPVSNSRSDNDRNAQNYRTVVMDRVKNNIADKWNDAAPYYFFLSAISDSKETHLERLTVHFPELLDPRLGDLKASLQINFMVELGWLLAQYHIMGHKGKPMTLLYGEGDENMSRCPSHVTAVKIKCPSPFGSHHTYMEYHALLPKFVNAVLYACVNRTVKVNTTKSQANSCLKCSAILECAIGNTRKMSVMLYTDDSVRVIVSTGNLVESDWDNRTQGVWIGPRCPPLNENEDTGSGDSPTNFKKDFLQYLTSYKLPELQEWVGHIRRADFSSVRVFFIASVPGTHHGLEYDYWAQGKLSYILKRHATIKPSSAASDWQIIAQCSSIGSLGPEPNSWMAGQMKLMFSSGQELGFPAKDISLIYPSFENVAASHDGLLGGGCLPYSQKTHQKQLWLHKFLKQWKSDSRYRSKAMPHIKTYCRISPDHKFLSWFLLTSANLSKAAWGNSKTAGKNYVMSYEAGVLFVPKFLTTQDSFPIHKDVSTKDAPLFPMPYDVPLKPYDASDIPWFFENIG